MGARRRLWPDSGSGGGRRSVHSLAYIEHLDTDHPSFSVEIQHNARRHLFRADGCDTLRAEPDKHRVGLRVIGSSDDVRAPRSKCTVMISISPPSRRWTTR